MKFIPRFSFFPGTPGRSRLFLLLLFSVLSPSGGFATSGSWTGLVNGDWSNAGNWSASPPPGSTLVTNNTETATFNGAGNGNTLLTIDPNRNLRTIQFDGATTSYTLGSAGANGGNGLRLTSSSTISLLATATGVNLTQTFNAPLTFYGNATFTNALADLGSALVFAGNISNAATSTLTLSGAGTGTGNRISGNISDGTGVQSVTITTTAGNWTLSGANSYSGLTSITGDGATVVLAGSNSSAGATTLNHANATLQLNSATNGGLASGLLTLSAGTLEVINADRTLSNAVTLGGSVTISGGHDLTLNGKLSSANFRTLTNNIASGNTLTLSDVDIATDTGANRVLTIAGSGNTTINGVIANGSGTNSGLGNGGTGTLVLKGANTYTGATTLNGGTTILDATGSTASLDSASTLAFGGGTFIFKGNNAGTGQTLGNVTVSAASGSELRVVGGTAGTTLALGTFSQGTDGSLLNIHLDQTNGAATVTTSTAMTNDLFSRAYVTLTVGSTTEFATKSGTNLAQYTGQSVFVGTGASSSTNYKLSGSGIVTAASQLQMATLRIDTSASGQSLDLNGKALQLANSGLLFVGANDYEIKDTAGGGAFNGGGSNAQLNLHHYGAGVLTISAAIVSPSGTSTLSINGPGTTVLSGVNLYSGNSLFGGGATVSIGASSALGNNATNARSIILNNATLRATQSFSLINGSNARLITLAANGGTLEVSGSHTLTTPGVISGAGGLRKSGSGTLELTAANTFTGVASITAGTLLVSGSGTINTVKSVNISGAASKLRYDSSLALSRGVTVAAGGTFAYNSSANYTGAFTFANGSLGGTNWNGSLGGLTIGANQTLAPGNSPGAANTTSQTWAGLGSYYWEINQADGAAGSDPGWDLINFSGSLALTATSASRFTINVLSLGLDNAPGNAANFNSALDYHWLLADAANPISTFSADKFTVNLNGFTNAYNGTFQVVRGDAAGIGGDNTQLYLTYTAIPEPSTWALVGLAGGFGFWFRRRK